MGESTWRWSPEYEDQLWGLLVTAAGELPALVWAREVKPDLVALQQETIGQIPAAGACSHFIHESFNPGGQTLSRLATEFNNLAGVKWVGGYQLKHGARPVSMATWEEVDGDRLDLVDAFAAFPSRSRFLAAYQELLSFPRYAGALAYAGQPLLWLHQVWASGWATDSRYLGGLGHWMTATWPIYQDTLPAAPAHTPPEPPKVPVLLNGAEIGEGLIVDGRTYLPVRAVGEALKLGVHWDGQRVLLSGQV